MKLTTNIQKLFNEIFEQEFSDDIAYSSKNDFFEYFAASIILKNSELSYDNLIDGITGCGNDGGIDGIYIIADDNYIGEDNADVTISKGGTLHVSIIQAKLESSFKEDAIMKWKTVSQNLLQMSYDTDYSTRYTERVIRSFDRFKEIIKKNVRTLKNIVINYHYATLGLAEEIHPNVIAQSEELKQIVKANFPNAEVNIDFWDANRLFTAYNDTPELVMSLNLAETPISLTESAFLSLVKLTDLFHFILGNNNEIRKSIFEANIRDYQGANAVNSSISATLVNQSDKEDFWWLNNGITIVAENVSRITGKTLRLTNPQIVNGLQTSREVYKYFQNNPDKIETDNRSVIVRIIKPTDEDSRDSIIFATNNQTNIPQYTLRVSEPIHKQIELYLKNRGLYYDRRKNYYKNSGKKRHEIVSVSFLAQCLISIILKKPDYARARPSSILSDEKIYASIYSGKIDLVAYYNAAFLGQKVKNVIQEKLDLKQPEINDILFFVIYSIIRKIVNSLDVTFDDLTKLDTELVTEDSIINSTNLIYTLYKDHGAKSEVVKSQNFVAIVDSELRNQGFIVPKGGTRMV